MITRDVWLVLNEQQKLDKLKEALTQLRDIDLPKSKLKGRIDQGRLANVKKSLEEFIIDEAVAWESEKLLQKYH